MKIRKAQLPELGQILDLIEDCEPYLIRHNDFTYTLLFRYFPTLCKVLIEEKQIIGYMGGFTCTPQSSTSYLWQVGIKSEFRGKGLAAQLLADFVQETRSLGCDRIEFSLEPDNCQSLKAFESFAKASDISMEKLDKLTYKKPNAESRSIDQFYRYIL